MAYPNSNEGCNDIEIIAVCLGAFTTSYRVFFFSYLDDRSQCDALVSFNYTF